MDWGGCSYRHCWAVGHLSENSGEPGEELEGQISEAIEIILLCGRLKKSFLTHCKDKFSLTISVTISATFGKSGLASRLFIRLAMAPSSAGFTPGRLGTGGGETRARFRSGESALN